MAKEAPDSGIQISLLDRLTDREPENRFEPPSRHAQSLRQLKASLRRDLEWLLNARRTPVEIPVSARELARSVFAYGLPDISGMAVSSPNDQQRLARVMETAIANFEPRLRNVAVTILPMQGLTRVLRFRIEGVLRIEPSPQRIYFDTALHLASAEYEVEGEKRAG